MKNTQLRIGNKVLHNGVVKTVDLISPGYVAFLEDRPNKDIFGEWVDLDEVEFIEITEEILVKIKGIKISFASDPQEQAASKLYKIGLLKIYQPNENVCYFITPYKESTITIKHLHILQNITYFLTNKELEINL